MVSFYDSRIYYLQTIIFVVFVSVKMRFFETNSIGLSFMKSVCCPLIVSVLKQKRLIYPCYSKSIALYLKRR